MSGYAFEFTGHGVFTPDGRVDMPADEVAAHNAQLEAEELVAWSEKPERWVVYVIGSIENTGPWRPNACSVVRGDKVTTWLGTQLGTIISARTYRHNFGSRMTAIRFRGTNGAEYYGRFGSDWSQMCRVRKAQGGRAS